MQRQVWLAERQAALAVGYDADAATYGDDKYPWDMQREWVARVLRLIPPGAIVLDAPCGTGKYFPMLAAGRCSCRGRRPQGGLASARRSLLSPVR